MDPGDFFVGGPDQDGIILFGTAGNDHIRVGRQVGPNGPQAVVRLNGETQLYDYLDGETIFVFAGAGNDRVTMDASAGLRWRAEFYGEEGNDHLLGGATSDLLDGGAGLDVLHTLQQRERRREILWVEAPSYGQEIIEACEQSQALGGVGIANAMSRCTWAPTQRRAIAAAAPPPPPPTCCCRQKDRRRGHLGPSRT